MRRLTKAERMAAMAVIGAAAAVTGAGVTLLKKHARYMTRKAAAFFDREGALDDLVVDEAADEFLWEKDTESIVDAADDVEETENVVDAAGEAVDNTEDEEENS